MFTNVQNQDAVFQPHAVDFDVAVTGADSAHLVLPAHHAYLGRRPSAPALCGKPSPRPSGTSAGAGTGCGGDALRGRRLRRDEAMPSWPVSSRIAGELPAAGWAMLVLNRALGA